MSLHWDCLLCEKQAAKTVSTVEIHPLILGMDKRKVHRGVVEKANLVQHLRSFRPQQTVFEVTGAVDDFVSVFPALASVISDGHRVFLSFTQARAIASGKAKDLHGAEVMEAFRREVRSSLQRNKQPDAVEERAAADDGARDDDHDGDDQHAEEIHTAPVDAEPSKKRLSKAQRKKLKQQGVTAEQLGKIQRSDTSEPPTKKKVSAAKDFKDQAHYISYGTEEESFVEAALQPRAGERNAEKMGADLLESAYLDITPDEALEMSKKKRILHWDQKKRKYVRTTLKDLAEQVSAASMLRCLRDTALFHAVSLLLLHVHMCLAWIQEDPNGIRRQDLGLECERGRDVRQVEEEEPRRNWSPARGRVPRGGFQSGLVFVLAGVFRLADTSFLFDCNRGRVSRSTKMSRTSCETLRRSASSGSRKTDWRRSTCAVAR